LVKYIYSDRYAVDFQGHVFPVDKYRLVFERLTALGILNDSNVLEPEMPIREDLLLAVTPGYLNDMENLRWTFATARSEMALTGEIIQFSKLTVGGTMLACMQALECGIGFHIGGGFHHAFEDHAEGFCYINDIAAAIRKVRSEKRGSKFAVIDCDLHQGNGTARIFQQDPLVFTFSIHQDNLYPIKERSDMDIGLSDYAGDEEYLNELNQHVPSIMKKFEPDLCVFVAGADPYREDKLGMLELTKEGLKQRDKIVVRSAREMGIPLAVVLAGGYAANTNDTVEIHTNTSLVCEKIEAKTGKR
jgi:acetoin utilization deacetylase AcuC-like enzyme